MDQYYVTLTVLFVIAVLSSVGLIAAVKLIRAVRRKQPLAGRIVLLSLDGVLLAGAVLFAMSHPTCWKYSDWAIVGSEISSVEEMYGPFDTGSVQEGRPGKAGYYICTDNGPVMPDHLEHYYMMHYDENGIITKVEESLPEGG